MQKQAKYIILRCRVRTHVCAMYLLDEYCAVLSISLHKPLQTVTFHYLQYLKAIKVYFYVTVDFKTFITQLAYFKLNSVYFYCTSSQ